MEAVGLALLKLETGLKVRATSFIYLYAFGDYEPDRCDEVSFILELLSVPRKLTDLNDCNFSFNFSFSKYVVVSVRYYTYSNGKYYTLYMLVYMLVYV